MNNDKVGILSRDVNMDNDVVGVLREGNMTNDVVGVLRKKKYD